MATVTITGDPFVGYRVHFPYDPTLVALIKSAVPAGQRRWDPEAKRWTILDTFSANYFARKARAAGHAVEMDGVRHESDSRFRGQQQAPPRSSSTVSTDWATALLRAVGKERQDAVYKALSRVLHPDVGGDTELMQQLNEARRRVA
jgi:hypothetical protein